MAITVKIIPQLPLTGSLASSDLTHLGVENTDKSLAMALLIRHVMNVLHPVGIVEQFTNTQNPNTIFPGQSWRRLTEGNKLSLRTSNESGTDVRQTGGADEVGLVAGNIPAHAHAINLTAGSYGQNNNTTSQVGNHVHSATAAAAGNHDHQGDMVSPGRSWGSFGKGTDNTGNYGKHLTSAAGNHQHTVGVNYAGVHTHTFAVGAHTHTLTGSTANTGAGGRFTTTNKYIMLAHWIRES